MDKLASKLTGHSNKSGSSSSNNEDYVDKGLDAVEKKYGHGMVDPNDPKTRNMNEKITDGAREQFEKSTGINVPDKVSN